jgi:hypothetical protein
MSTQHNDGGPAFPTPTVVNANSEFQWGDNGMSLRDYFAGQALAGNLIEPTANNEQVAKWAYSLADAMLAAREGKK